MPEDAQCCPACGTQVIRVPASAPIAWNPQQTETVYRQRPAFGGAADARQLHYAGFWIRAAAYVVDLALVGLLTTPVLGMVAPLTGNRWEEYSRLPPKEIFNMQNPAVLAFLTVALPIAFVCGWLYYALFESSAWQGTPGKRLLGLRVSDLRGRPIGFGRATGRFIGRVLEGLLPFGIIGYAFAGFTARKQAVHDMLAGCVVLRDL